MKQYFSAGLYREGLKRARTTGVAAALVMIFGSVWRIIIKWFEKVSDKGAPALETSEVVRVSAAGFMPVCLLALLFAPLIVKSVFSFLNRRSQSDFYHSVPQKRACVCLSFTAAALTWVVGISTACALCCYFGWNALPGYSASAAAAAKAALSYTALGLLGASCMALGMMYTGSSAANVLASLVIFGLPAITIVAFGGILDVLEPSFVYEKSLIYRLTQRYFLPSTFHPFAPADGDFFNPKGPAVWLAVAVSTALFALAGAAYVRRKSETAENAASSPLVRRVLLLCFTLMPCLFAAVLVADDLNPATLSLWLWALILYCVCEIIMTKSLKSLAKSLPLFLLLPLVCVLLAGSAYLGAAKVRADSPKSADEVEYVVIDEFYAEFPLNLVRGEKISDAAVIEAVTDGFRYGDRLRRGAHDFGHGVFMLRLNNGKKLWRECGADITVLGRALLNCPQTRGKLLALPDCDADSTDVPQEVWERFKSEYGALTDAQKCETLLANEADCEIRVWVSGSSFTYRLSEKLFPRTCSMIKAANDADQNEKAPSAGSGQRAENAA